MEVPIKIQRVRKKTPFLVVLISLLLMLAQHYGWLDQVAPKTAGVSTGYYRVSEFYDGDTIAVDMNGKVEKIRFIGVDTPETHDPRKPVQCFGRAAADFTKQLVGAKEVRLEADPKSTNRDRYDRLLRYVYLPDQTLVNAEIIKQGYGFAYMSFPFTKSEEFKTLENFAKQNNRGLWGSCSPTVNSKGFVNSNPE